MHPCRSCGACCATFRVSFYWAECASGGGAVPDALAERISPFLAAMVGTSSHPPRCIAHAGEVGRSSACTIYEHRPSPCHELRASWEDGTPDDRCDRARARHGLPPLTPADFPPGR